MTNVIPLDPKKRILASLRPASLSEAQAAVAVLAKALPIMPSILLAQLVVARLAARCSSAASMRLLLLLPPRPPWPRARCESPALALGIASLLIGFASLPGFQARARGLAAHSTRLP
jgi:hypothetical protein